MVQTVTDTFSYKLWHCWLKHKNWNRDDHPTDIKGKYARYVDTHRLNLITNWKNWQKADTCPSAAQVTMLRSSEWGMILAWKTLLLWPEWKESLIRPVSQSQRITLQSSEPDTRMSPSVLKLTVLTQPLCLCSFLSTSSRRTRSYKTHNSTLINNQGRALSFWIEAHSHSRFTGLQRSQIIII